MAVCVFFGTFARTDMPGDIMGGANFMAYFPFFADIEGMKWLIAGGGGVALRKVRDLLPYGAVIEVVSPDMSPGLDEMAQDIAYTDTLKLTRREFEDRDLDRADFVIAATSEPGLNSRISALCRSKKDSCKCGGCEGGMFLYLPVHCAGRSCGGGNFYRRHEPVIARYLKARIQSAMPDSLGDLTAGWGLTERRSKTCSLTRPRSVQPVLRAGGGRAQP